MILIVFLLAGITSNWLFQEENMSGGFGFHCITEDDLVLEELDRVHKSLLWFFGLSQVYMFWSVVFWLLVLQRKCLMPDQLLFLFK